MTSVAKLKERARKLEQKEDWKAAIEAYRTALDSEERADDAEVELALYNRVGDLYLRIGQTDEAVTYYEEAADKYADSGFYNNAIALCNKALRHRPNRAHIYLKLSRLSAEQGFLPDARRWVLEYSNRQLQAGNEEAAFTGLEEFADMSDDPDVREILARQLAGRGRRDDALDQLRKAHATWSARGDRSAAERVAGEARDLDPSFALRDGASGAAAGADAPADFEQPYVPPARAPGGLDGLETHRRGPGADWPGMRPEPLPGLETTGPDVEEEEEEEEPEPLPLLDTGYEAIVEEPEQGEEEEEEEEPEEPEELEEPEQPLPLMDTGYEATSPEPEEEEAEAPEEPAEPLPLSSGAPGDMLEAESVEEPEAPQATGEAEPREHAGEPFVAGPPEHRVEAVREEPVGDAGAGEPADDELLDLADVLEEPEPGDEEPLLDVGMLDLSFGEVTGQGEPSYWEAEVDLDAVLDRARELVGRGLAPEALKELNIVLAANPGSEALQAALQVVAEIIRHDPNDVAALQQRVELASKLGEPDVMVSAFLELGDALARLGSETKARAMYERVLDLDPDNAAALDALGDGGDAGDDETVDLSAVLREMGPEERAAALAGEAAGGDPNVAAMLSQFRERSSDGAGGDDAGDHYDLGLAFKEMGLVDEAIAEFQTALTGGEERLKVYEELGQCFMLKRQFNIALNVFDRALQVPRSDERELLGVYYHLGQCHEELGQRAEAREAYGRILDIDDGFADVPDRVARL